MNSGDVPESKVEAEDDVDGSADYQEHESRPHLYNDRLHMIGSYNNNLQGNGQS